VCIFPHIHKRIFHLNISFNVIKCKIPLCGFLIIFSIIIQHNFLNWFNIRFVCIQSHAMIEFSSITRFKILVIFPFYTLNFCASLRSKFSFSFIHINCINIKIQIIINWIIFGFYLSGFIVLFPNSDTSWFCFAWASVFKINVICH